VGLKPAGQQSANSGSGSMSGFPSDRRGSGQAENHQQHALGRSQKPTLVAFQPMLAAAGWPGDLACSQLFLKLRLLISQWLMGFERSLAGSVSTLL